MPGTVTFPRHEGTGQRGTGRPRSSRGQYRIAFFKDIVDRLLDGAFKQELRMACFIAESRDFRKFDLKLPANVSDEVTNGLVDGESLLEHRQLELSPLPRNG